MQPAGIRVFQFLMAQAKKVKAKEKARKDSESTDGHKGQTDAINT